MNDFFALIFFKKKIGLSLKDKTYAYFFVGFCFHLIVNSKDCILRKNKSFFLFKCVTYEKSF